MADDLVERRYLLIKRGLYYGPDNRGYTGFKERAGRYLESEADLISGVTAVHEDEAGEIAPSCFDDLARGWLQSKLAEARAENARLTEERDALVESAYREGHARGRVDGSPFEEDDDWMNSAALAKVKGGTDAR